MAEAEASASKVLVGVQELPTRGDVADIEDTAAAVDVAFDDLRDRRIDDVGARLRNPDEFDSICDLIAGVLGTSQVSEPGLDNHLGLVARGENMTVTQDELVG